MTSSTTPPLGVRVRTSIDRWLEPGLPWLERAGDLGQVKFEDALRIVADVVALARLADQVGVERIPQEYLVELESAFASVNDAARPLETVTIQELADATRDRRRQLLAKLTDATNKFRTATVGPRAFLSAVTVVGAQAVTFKNAGEVAERLAQREVFFDKLAKRLEEPATRKVRDEGSASFQDAATEYRNQSTAWLRAGGSLAALFAISVCAVVFDWGIVPSLDTTTGARVAAGIFSRLLWFGLIGSLTGWSFRQYSIRMHLSTVNQQRSMTISSITLLAGTVGESPEAKHAVLLRATDAIVTPQATGFADADGPRLGSPGVSDVLKSLRSD